MGISEQDVADYIEKCGKKAGEHTSVWVVKMPSVLNMAVFGPMAALFDMKYNILNISEEGIVVIGVDGAGRLRPEHFFFSREHIQEVSIKKGMLSYDICIKMENGFLKYRLNKVMVGSGFHKGNVEHAIQKLEAFK